MAGKVSEPEKREIITSFVIRTDMISFRTDHKAKSSWETMRLKSNYRRRLKLEGLGGKTCYSNYKSRNRKLGKIINYQ
jgi:hypothetical protein